MIALYDAVVPVFLQMLASTGRMLAKAERHCDAMGMTPAALLGARLAPDMWDCATQIRALCVQSACALEGALSGAFAPAYPPAPTDFDGLQALVGDAIARIKAVPRKAVDALAGQDVALCYAGNARPFTAEAFLTGFALPNFLFHVSIAYGVMRTNGVPLGKADYLGRIPVKAPVCDVR